MSDTPTLFDEPTPDVHARRSDPNSSHRTVASLGKDGSIKQLIWTTFQSSKRIAIEYGGDGALNDTWLTQLIELRTNRRQQRNVIARSRGLMVQDGYLIGVGERDYDGRMIEHYIINPDHPPLTTTKEQ